MNCLNKKSLSNVTKTIVRIIMLVVTKVVTLNSKVP